jgi:hypothetical protein
VRERLAPSFLDKSRFVPHCGGARGNTEEQVILLPLRRWGNACPDYEDRPDRKASGSLFYLFDMRGKEALPCRSKTFSRPAEGVG